MANTPLTKTFTVLSRTAPYGSVRPHLCLDIALAAAVFEQQVNYVFLNDGVYQLLNKQDGAAIETKTIGKALGTLNLYGIDNVYVCKDSLSLRQLEVADLVLPATLIGAGELHEMLDNTDCVFNF